MKINWSIKLGIGALIIMVFGWIFFPAHTLHEWKEFLIDLSAWLLLFAIMWFAAWRFSCIVKYNEEEERKERVLDLIDSRKGEIKMPEMRTNAESFLTQDQKAHLYMVSKNPHLKAPEELSEKDKIKKFVHGSTIDIKA